MVFGASYVGSALAKVLETVRKHCIGAMVREASVVVELCVWMSQIGYAHALWMVTAKEQIWPQLSEAAPNPSDTRGMRSPLFV